MSLAIEVDDVVEVLLQDGWHPVVDETFEIDAYEFRHGDVVRVSGGSIEGVSSTGATWKEPSGVWVACPFPQIRAVKLRAPTRQSEEDGGDLTEGEGSDDPDFH
jgi:hypothetical protein